MSTFPKPQDHKDEVQPQLGGGEESKSPPRLPDTLSLPIQAQAQLIAELEKIIHVPMMLVNQGPSGKQRVREASNLMPGRQDLYRLGHQMLQSGWGWGWGFRREEAHASGQSPEEQGLCTDALNALGFLP